MRWSQTLIPTLREAPKEAEAASHRLLMRGGFVRQLSSGVYSYLPLGQRVLGKVCRIIREEMAAAGADEVFLPALHPAELWKRSGRYDTLGGDKISFQSRAGQEFVLGPTHEEVITELVGANLRSYQNLPLILYQIQTKFRDELRPRFGIIRTREFIMKDAYSFDRDEDGLDRSYQKMLAAYQRIFERIGLPCQIVSADPGMMGGKVSQEFMVESRYGEDHVVQCGQCGRMTSRDIAFRAKRAVTPSPSKESDALPEYFDTPQLRTIDEISSCFKFPPRKILKTLFYLGDNKPIAVLVLGSDDINEAKLRRLAGVRALKMAPPEEIRKITGAPVGFSGPVGLKNVPIFADWDVEGEVDLIAGANQQDKHLKHVNWGRDFQATAGDLRLTKEGDRCPECGGELKMITTMELGHIFKLGTRYSEALDCSFVDVDGRRKPAIMGCYGIGVNRSLAAIVEEHHDDRGIRWPHSVAPFSVHLITVNQSEPMTQEAADKLYIELQTAGVEVLYDDRNERAGVKFNDADLLGLPFQVILGEKNLKEGKIEVKDRKSGAVDRIAVNEAVSALQQAK